ncbi:MAG: hypothetical protein OEY86_16345 [Nitrospira sp.]|nr:hypothetical protein [Nitrospira sp.]
MSPDVLQRKDPMKSSVRARQFRDRLRTEECGRLDVWIGKGWIRGLRVIAQHHNLSLWAVVQEAVKDYVTKHARIITPPRDRDR